MVPDNAHQETSLVPYHKAKVSAESTAFVVVETIRGCEPLSESAFEVRRSSQARFRPTIGVNCELASVCAASILLCWAALIGKKITRRRSAEESKDEKRGTQRAVSLRRLGRNICTVGIAALITSQVAAIDTHNGVTWTVSGSSAKPCYVASDPDYQAKLEKLGELALGQSDDAKGCVTFPYLAEPYDADGTLNPKGPPILNDVHAGIDLRASDDDSVYAITDGTVVFRNLCLGNSPPEPTCAVADGLPHSTLIIENFAKTHKIFYLHLSKYEKSIQPKAKIKKGDLLGKAGSVGAAAPHLHLEVWASQSEHWCTRNASVAGSSCSGKPARTIPDKNKTKNIYAYCELEDIRRLTVDPITALEYFANTEPWAATKLSAADRLTLNTFGPVKVGMSVAEAANAIQGELITEAGSPEDCAYLRPRHGPGGVRFMAVKNTIVRMDVDSCQIRTRSGAAIGNTKASVEQLYGNAQSLTLEVSENKYDPQWHDLTLVPSNPGDLRYRMIFQTDEKNRLRTFRAGQVPEVEWVEGCM